MGATQSMKMLAREMEAVRAENKRLRHENLDLQRLVVKAVPVEGLVVACDDEDSYYIGTKRAMFAGTRLDLAKQAIRVGAIGIKDVVVVEDEELIASDWVEANPIFPVITSSVLVDGGTPLMTHRTYRALIDEELYSGAISYQRYKERLSNLHNTSTYL